MLPYSSMLLAILLWSTLPLVLHGTGNPTTVIAILLEAQVFAVLGLVFLLWHYSRKDLILLLLPRLRKCYSEIAICGLAIAVHNSILYYAYTTDFVVLALLLSEMWPLVAIFVAPAIVPKQWIRVRHADYAVVSLGGFGAALLVLAGNADQFTWSGFWALLMGVQAALNALVSLLIPRIARKIDSSGTLTSVAISQIAARTASVLPLAIATFLIGSDLAVMQIVVGAYIGLAVIAIGSTAYSFSMVHARTPVINALWWLTPILSLTWLVVTQNTKLSWIAAIGGMTIIASNVFVQIPFRYRIAPLGTSVYVIISLYILYFTQRGLQTNDLYIIPLLVMALSIISAFLLQRVTRGEADEISDFDKLSSSLASLRAALVETKEIEDGARKKILDDIDVLYALIVQQIYGRGSPSLGIQPCLHRLSELRNVACGAHGQVFQEKLDDIDGNLMKWYSQRRRLIGGFETMLFMLLAIVTSACVLLARPEHVIAQLASIALTSTFIFIALRIFSAAFYISPLDIERMREAQISYVRDRSIVFVPRWAVEALALSPARICIDIAFLTEGDQELEIESLPAVHVVLRVLPIAVLAVVPSIMLIALLVQ